MFESIEKLIQWCDREDAKQLGVLSNMSLIGNANEVLSKLPAAAEAAAWRAVILQFRWWLANLSNLTLARLKSEVGETMMNVELTMYGPANNAVAQVQFKVWQATYRMFY